MQNNPQTSEQKMIRSLMLGGLIFSVVLFILGIISHALSSTPAAAIKLNDIISSNVFWGQRCLGLGILILSSLPVLRVLVLMSIWIRDRDWKYAGTALLVLITLAFSIWSGNLH